MVLRIFSLIFVVIIILDEWNAKEMNVQSNV